MAHCKSITLIENINNVDVMLCQIDDVSAYWFYDYSKALQFVDQDVIVSYRDDMYKGQMVKAVNTLAAPYVVNVLDKHTNMRLYVDEEDNKSNLSFNEIQMGESRDGCIVYCCDCSLQTSAAAQWLECIIRDKMFRVAKLRIFDPEQAVNLTGKYCMCTLRKTQYGLQSDMIVATSTEVAPNPEIDIAKNYILDFFKEDESAMNFITSTALLDAMDTIVDYEKGYMVVRLATEICLCEQFYNVSKDIDVRVLTHAFLASYGYITRPNIPMSEETRSVLVATSHKWTNTPLLMRIIDPGTLEKEPLERDMFRKIRAMVESIIKSRKTYTD